MYKEIHINAMNRTVITFIKLFEFFIKFYSVIIEFPIYLIFGLIIVMILIPTYVIFFISEFFK